MRWLTDLWVASGCPEPNWTGKAKTARAVPPTRHGVCALTGVTGPVVDIGHVLSDLYTGWDRLPYRNHPLAGISTPVAWAFRERPFMMWPHVALDGGPISRATPAALYSALAVLPARRDGVVCVPTSMQKHLLPFATPGTVRTDDETLAWTTTDVDRLGMVRRLRGFGFGEAAMTEPSPRYPTLLKLAPADQAAVLAAWRDLAVWRARPAYLDVAFRATRTLKEKESQDG